jgi:hypothetical protein
LTLAVVRDLRDARPVAGPEELAAFEADARRWLLPLLSGLPRVV